MNNIFEFMNTKNKKVGKMEVENQSVESADLYIYGDIVSSQWSKWEDTDTCPEDILSLLEPIQDVKNLNIYINSGGGSVFAGMAIYNILKRHKAYKTVYVDGLAGSISSIICMVGDKIIVPKNAYLLIHKPWAGVTGNANDLRKLANDLDGIEECIVNIYADRLKEGVDIEDIKTMVNDETWLTGDKASQYFNIEVGEENKIVACTSDYFNNYSKLPKELHIKDELHNREKKLTDNQNDKEDELSLEIANILKDTEIFITLNR